VRGFESISFGKGVGRRSYRKGKVRRATNGVSQIKLRCASRERFELTTVSSVRKLYLEENRAEYDTFS